MKIRAAITGVGGFVPDYILSNRELETMVETTDEWIKTRTGISERRILKGEGMGMSHMAVKAIDNLKNKTGLKSEEIELIICATTTPDYVFPASANLIGAEIGAVNAFGFDVQAACSGFLYALITGSQFIESGKYKKILVVGGDKMSSIINYKDRNTCIIFGDGCGVVLLEPDMNGNGIMDSILRSDGNGSKYLFMKAGGSRYPASTESVGKEEHYVFQEGKTVFKFAVQNMADTAYEIMQRNNLSGEHIQWLVPHQANKRIIDATADRMGISQEKIMLNVNRYGNTTNGTLPLCLWDYESKLRKNDNLIFATFGGGFTWGACFLKWGYDGSRK
ncbi:MAG: 3-oxoacyl-ACP synthase [Bacteroidetes bacterium RIFCSPLOWO2_02_FULL_36_8]|nr:MAG: 3-oxoacyl-ACP synthase [Bacteroidetes bacterium RIFCSPLOWO2_02_FULL_36_8]OFY68905.1 MAG: 3-oxoacyl-ACP synthase [Bacteroidetes bacterium RIFCSPLOWO2_12_FULL_37_12]